MAPAWALGALALALLLFAAPDRRPLKRLSGGAWALYNTISLLGNVASYARIFGLGLATGVVALVVNKIALACAQGPLGWPVAVLILLVGHSFNFVMAIIGAVLHPARLQFFEFFGTFIEGEGRPYRPFCSGGQ